DLAGLLGHGAVYGSGAHGALQRLGVADLAHLAPALCDQMGNGIVGDRLERGVRAYGLLEPIKVHGGDGGVLVILPHLVPVTAGGIAPGLRSVETLALGNFPRRLLPPRLQPCSCFALRSLAAVALKSST